MLYMKENIPSRPLRDRPIFPDLKLLQLRSIKTNADPFFLGIYSRVLNNRLPPPPLPPDLLLIFRFFFHPGHLYSNPPIINFQSFLLPFLSVNSHFHHSPSSKKEIVQSSTITMNYVNTKHMLSL